MKANVHFGESFFYLHSKIIMENLCRLCGNMYEFMIGVFDNVCEGRQLHSKITKVLQININAEDPLPKKICTDCHKRLDDAFIFISSCLDAQNRLEELSHASQNLQFVKHSNHDLNCPPSWPFILPNYTNSQSNAFLENDANPEIHVIPLRIELTEEKNLEMVITEEPATHEITEEKNVLLRAGGNNDSETDTSNDTMESKIEVNALCYDTNINNYSEHDTKGKKKEKHKTNTQPLAPLLKTSKRTRITKNEMKDLILKKNKKFVPKSQGDQDYLTGLELVRDKKKWTCETCQMTFLQESIYLEHLNVHSGNRPYSCKLCTASFRKRQGLNQHLRTVHSRKQYKCTACEHIAKHKGKLTEHMRNVHEKPFTCDLCAYRTGEKGKIQQHIANKHDGDLSYVCEICGVGLRTRPSLQAHRMNVHFPEPKVCQKCGVVCPSLSRYSAHVYRCGKERERYTCEKCGKTYVTKEVLKDHMNTHLNITPYKCSVCGKEFHHRSRLHRHNYVHGEPVYQCEICSQSFRRKDNMKIHMKKHFYKPIKYENTMITAV